MSIMDVNKKKNTLLCEKSKSKTNESPREVSSMAAYHKKLSLWTWQYYHWVLYWHWHSHVMSSIQQPAQQLSSSSRVVATGGSTSSSNQIQSINVRFFGLIGEGGNVARLQTHRVPQLWKRIAAEAIDFVLLFILKIGVTVLTIDCLGLFDLDKYDLNAVIEDMRLETLLDMTTELMILEVIHRLCVVAFETVYVSKWGATPGKRALDLRVISCDGVQPLNDSSALIIRPGPVNLGRAFLRAFVKNLLNTFLFPACATSLVFRHGRASYDFLSRTIVVEDNRPRNRNERPLQ